MHFQALPPLSWNILFLPITNQMLTPSWNCHVLCDLEIIVGCKVEWNMLKVESVLEKKYHGFGYVEKRTLVQFRYCSFRLFLLDYLGGSGEQLLTLCQRWALLIPPTRLWSFFGSSFDINSSLPPSLYVCLTGRMCLKQHPMSYIVHYIWPEPYRPWSSIAL